MSLIAETRFSDVLRTPVKALVTLSDIADNELSEMARAPAKTLPTASEGTRLSSGNFPAPLLTESAIETTSDRDLAGPLFTTSEIVDARFSDVVLNPVKTLDAASDMMGVSDSVLNPLKALATASEGTRLSSGNFPAPLLTESAIETTSDRDLAAPLPTTSEIVDARFSDVVLNPVKTLDAASDMMGVSDSVLNPLKALATASEGTRLSSGNFPETGSAPCRDGE